MVIGRLIGWMLLLAAAAVLVRDLIVWLDTGIFVPITADALWFEIDRGSRLATEAMVEASPIPWLWQSVIAAMLSLWAMLVLALPGVFLLLLFRRRSSGRRRRRR